jgi:formamidopyrimidine-DNA glycosylase
LPELPDVVLYVEALAARVGGRVLERVRVAGPFLVRTVDPPLTAVAGRRITGVSRLGKRVVFGLEGDLFVAVHLMIAGRFRWRPEPGASLPGRIGLAAFDIPPGTLLLTEAGRKRRAALHVLTAAGLAELDPGGVEPLEASEASFREALGSGNHTLKRALTDPRLVSGIGNAYSDEILHRARLSPLRLTSRLTAPEWSRLHGAVREVLREWIERLREDTGAAFPEKVTAFRPGMAVHGRFGKPCPACGSPVQRIVYAENECNYCARCQTGGRLLADRALSRLLRGDWPRSLEELEGG